MIPATPAFLAGFAAEAKIARRSGWPVATGGGSTAGAARAVQQLIEAGVTGVVSFGLAGGLDPALPAGTVIVADAIVANGHVWRTDARLSELLGGTTGHLCLGVDHILSSPDEKQRLGRETGASLADMESGAIARAACAAGLPFAVLRAVCDPADMTLPSAALVALDAAGHLALARLAWSVLTDPGQLGALIALARGAVAARRALRSRIEAIQRGVGVP